MTPVGLIGSGQLLLAIPVALLAGVVSFASPCVLPLIPGYLGYVGGMQQPHTTGPATTPHGERRSGRGRLILGAVLFIAGFSTVFVATGYLLGVAGFFLVQWRDVLTRLSGLLVLLLGLVFIGGIGPLQRMVKPTWQPKSGLLGAPLLGALFAIGWTPCLGPTLTAINALALQAGSAAQGALLALVYSIGLGLPFVLIAAGASWATGSLTFLRRHVRAINLIGGAMLIAVGLLMVTGLWLQVVGQLQYWWAGYVTAI